MVCIIILEDDEAEQLKNNTLAMTSSNVHGKNCNEVFDRGYYVVGDSSLVQNWPISNFGMLIVCISKPYTVQIAIGGSRFMFRLNPYSDKNRWEAWQTIK